MNLEKISMNEKLEDVIVAIETETPKIYKKNADKRMHRIMMPKAFINANGNEFYMLNYKRVSILIPIEDGE